MKKRLSIEERIQIERARAWLSRYRWIQAEVETAEDTLTALREMYDKIASSVGASIPSSVAVSNRTADAVEAVSSAEEKMLQKITEKAKLLERIAGAIERVGDDKHRVMLKDYFLKGMTWDEVADHIGYSESAVCHAANAALLAVEEPELFSLPETWGG